MFDNWDFATRFRDVIVTICEEVIERMRPGARYAEVVTIDHVNRSCTVRFPPDDAAVTVPMGSIHPVRIGQYVRVVGALGDRYIDDVMGEALVMGATPVGVVMQLPSGVPTPAGHLATNGAYLDPVTYPTLFSVYGFSQGQQGTQFRLPTVVGGIVRAT